MLMDVGPSWGLDLLMAAGDGTSATSLGQWLLSWNRTVGWSRPAQLLPLLPGSPLVIPPHIHVGSSTTCQNNGTAYSSTSTLDCRWNKPFPSQGGPLGILIMVTKSWRVEFVKLKAMVSPLMVKAFLTDFNSLKILNKFLSASLSPPARFPKHHGKNKNVCDTCKPKTSPVSFSVFIIGTISLT